MYTAYAKLGILQLWLLDSSFESYALSVKVIAILPIPFLA